MRVAILVLLLTTPAFADKWARPIPRAWSSESGSKLLEVFPRDSHHNKTTRPVAYLYDVKRTPDFHVTSKLVWTGPLVDVPVDAIVTDSGVVVTLDRWGNAGFDHAIVVYSRTGKLLASHHLDTLMPEEVSDRYRSVSSRDWRRFAGLSVDRRNLYISASGGTIEVSLIDGSAKYRGYDGRNSDAASPITLKPISIEFSSLTDRAQNCKP